MGFNLDSYEQVKDRITRFYKDHPDGAIHTELVTSPAELAKCAGFKAYCYIGLVLKATGYAYEQQGQGVNRDAWVENAETSAIGRALANMDYCGSLRPSREEMSKTEKGRGEARPDPVQAAAEVFEADPYQIARDRVVKDIQALVGKPGEKDAWPEAEKASLKLKELITEASQTKNADLLAVALERAKAFARLRTQGNNDATIKAILACPDVTRLAELGVV